MLPALVPFCTAVLPEDFTWPGTWTMKISALRDGVCGMVTCVPGTSNAGDVLISIWGPRPPLRHREGVSLSGSDLWREARGQVLQLKDRMCWTWQSWGEWTPGEAPAPAPALWLSRGWGAPSLPALGFPRRVGWTGSTPVLCDRRLLLLGLCLCVSQSVTRLPGSPRTPRSPRSECNHPRGHFLASPFYQRLCSFIPRSSL